MSSYSISTTTNETKNQSQAVGDLSTGNIIGGGNVSSVINGLYGEDMQAFMQGVKDIATTAATANSTLAGSSIQKVAESYQSAYSETTGMLQQLKPVLMLGAAALAFVYGYRYFK